MKQFVFLKDFGFIPAGRVLTQNITGDYFLSVTDQEAIDGTVPWLSEVRLKRAYVESLPADVLSADVGGVQAEERANACDFILASVVDAGTTGNPTHPLTRANAEQVIEAVASAIGMSDAGLASKLAHHWAKTPRG